ncbi:hypothetical protein CP533_1623 [Ophiocordyceps camponoti-saundersi (nom. inval.)]|nr:hypothetical protein CP533_1623 [Ophiocordyceps camponoti-saundersi (nom. inval.)]
MNDELQQCQVEILLFSACLLCHFGPRQTTDERTKIRDGIWHQVPFCLKQPASFRSRLNKGPLLPSSTLYDDAYDVPSPRRRCHNYDGPTRQSLVMSTGKKKVPWSDTMALISFSFPPPPRALQLPRRYRHSLPSTYNIHTYIQEI